MSDIYRIAFWHNHHDSAENDSFILFLIVDT